MSLISRVFRCLAIALFCLLTLAYPRATRADFDWSGAIQQMFSDLVHSAIPDAIAPVVTIAENADELALDGLTIALDKKKKERLVAAGDFSTHDPRQHQLEKDVNAIEQLISKTRDLKDKLNPPHKEEGWDPFFGRMMAGGPVSRPPLGSSQTVSLTLDLSATDEDHKPASYMVLPGPTGAVSLTVRPIASSATAKIHNDDNSGNYRLELLNFSYTLPSFQLFGAPTGLNTITMSTDVGLPLGRLTAPLVADGGTFTLRFGAELTNDLYGPGAPIGPAIPVFVQSRGAFHFSTGSALVTAEDPLLIPGLPGYTPGTPLFAAPTMVFLDSATNTLQFQDMFFDAEAGLNSGLDPKISFVRYMNNTYGTFNNSSDRIIDALLSIDDLHIATASEQLVTFDPSTLTIQDSAGVLLRAGLTNISLNVQTGDFYGDLDLSILGSIVDMSGSPFLTEYLAMPIKQIQFLSPQSAGELYLASGHFTMDGQTTMPDFINGVASAPEPGSLTLLGIGMLSLLCYCWRQRKPAGKLGARAGLRARARGHPLEGRGQGTKQISAVV